MQSNAAADRSPRFVETASALLLCLVAIDSFGAATNLFSAIIGALCALTLLVGAIGYYSAYARRGSWLLLLLSGVAITILQPLSASGPLFVVFSFFLLSISGLLAQRRVQKSAALALLVAAGQVVGLLVHPLELVGAVLRFLVFDAIFGFVLVKFSYEIRESSSHLFPLLKLQDYHFSRRELEVMHLIWGGMISKEIAADLDLSEGAVRNILSQIYKKLGVLNGKELYSLSLNHQIVLFDPQRESEKKKGESS